MITRCIKLALVVLLGVTLSQDALAFYNSSTGRWLNRDPINEPGFNRLIQSKNPLDLDEETNLYHFVRNNAANLSDRDGRDIGYGLGALLAVAGACAKPQYNLSLSRYPDSGDKFKHCWVSCRISKTCGAYIAELAGLSKEVRDRAIELYCVNNPNSDICKGGHGDFWDSLEDLAANQQCIGWEAILDLPGFPPVFAWTGALCRRSCEDCCKAKVGYKTGGP